MKKRKLKCPDTLQLQAAEGWLELGNYLEADAELQKIPARRRAHPDVLKLRWDIHSEIDSWETAAEVAEALVRVQPDDVENWYHRADALHQLKRTREARDHLFAALVRFPRDDELHYRLARCECQLGNLDEAKAWLQRAISVSRDISVRDDALEDPDFAPLWKHLGQRR